MRTVKFYTFGCKVNQYETQMMREQFERAGFEELDNHVPADVYVINTCTVTHNADSDSLGAIRRALRENPKAKIIATGCLSELDAKKIRQIDKRIVIIKNKEKENIIKRIRLAYESNQGDGSIFQAINEVEKIEPSPSFPGISFFKNHTRAFLKIQDGCNNFCSYCKVPYVRGRSRSKSLAEISREACALARNGYKEIVLTGICLGAYGKDFSLRKNLIDAIDTVEKIEGIMRIRVSSIEPTDVTDALIEKIARSKKLCRHLHIPLQSGDDSILKAMNRPYSAEYYLALIKKIRKKIPLVAITTDVMVGFPGETEDNFCYTLKAVKKIVPLKVHIFPYSPREGTAVLRQGGGPGRAVLRKRSLVLQRIAYTYAKKYKQKFLGKSIEVLFEAQDSADAQFWQGHTDNYILVAARSAMKLQGKHVLVRLDKLRPDGVVTCSLLIR